MVSCYPLGISGDPVVGIVLNPDGSYHAWTILEDDKGQEVSFSGYGHTREEALVSRDAALATGLKAFPGLKTPERIQKAAEESPYTQGKWDYAEARKAPAPCITVIEHPDGRTSHRDMDWNDRDARRRFLRKVGELCEAGTGRVTILPDPVVVEGMVS